MVRPTALSLPFRSGTADPGARFVSWLAHLRQMRRNWVTRRQLAELDAHLLRDIGVSAHAARCEADRLPWDPLAR